MPPPLDPEEAASGRTPAVRQEVEAGWYSSDAGSAGIRVYRPGRYPPFLSLLDLSAEARTAVFNNPFGSFHNTVAEAKEEREQLDRLLTVSTPRERLLVGAIALLLVGLSAWLFLGAVSRSLAVDGVVVEPGGSRSLQALVSIEPGIAPHIKAGMPARIELTVADGATETLAGEVTSISAVPLSGELAALATVAAVSAYRVQITTDESLALAPRAGQECRIVIELGRQTPLALLRLGPA